MFFSLIYFVSGKNTVKSLTESNGQEVIEIGTPIKDLPVGLEEEPGAEDDVDDDDEKSTLKNAGKVQVLSTKKEPKKPTTLASVKKDEIKDADKSKELNSDEDEERIEKELAEIYKDTADYKADSGDEKVVAKEPSGAVEQYTEEAGVTFAEDSDADKPIGRARNNFRFQPDSTDQANVEKFRTSVDEISCNNREKLKGTGTQATITEKPDSAFRTISNDVILITAVLFYVFICI
ncbi:hypothetical protein PYW07_012875 [Mythimna separata]|uniref:Uncharacterized protein n=1 Tax=Mythimna separata TaxID=271217 RepID=A0AAD7Y913_MYTSE|nr:hypothetical protein PYW07_012875 [Mythimna separata]